MIIIADSGSTKVDWRILQEGCPPFKVETKGINPVFQSRAQILELIWNGVMKNIEINPDFKTSSVFFYGAGVVSSDMSSLLYCCLKDIFVGANIYIESDLMGAARGLFHNTPGIACILGTGSNSCFYNGKEIADNVKCGGYILGDEGSGAYLGKKLISDYIKGLLPADLSDLFYERYRLDYPSIVTKVYREEFPSRFLSSFSPFLREFIDEPYIRNLLTNSFNEFIERNVLHYDFKRYKVGFIGSIAQVYSDIIKECALGKGLQVEQIVKSPMEGLIEYHSN